MNAKITIVLFPASYKGVEQEELNQCCPPLFGCHKDMEYDFVS